MTKETFGWVIAAALWTMSPSVLAARWEFVSESAGFRAEIDLDSLNRNGHVVQAWDRLTPPGGAAADDEGFSYRYIMSWSDYDCSSRRITVRRRIYVGDNARQIKEQHPIHQPIVSVVAGTPREALWAAVCEKSLPSTPAVKPAPATKAAPKTTSTAPKATPAAKPTVAPTPVPVKRPAADAKTSGTPRLLPNRRQAEVTPRPTPPATTTKPVVQASTTTASTRPPAASAITKQASQATTAAPAKTAAASGDERNLSRYLSNQLKRGVTGEIIVSTSVAAPLTFQSEPASKPKK